MEIEAIRQAAAPLSAVLPAAAWLPHALVRLPDGRLDKPPCEGARSNDPSSWFTLDGALDLLASRNGVAGVAFAITKGLIGLDYDNCRDPTTGELDRDVQAELERMDSFAYVTPSGKGIRIVGLNDAVAPITPGKSTRLLPSGAKVEVFVGPANFYNTFTADIIPGFDRIRDISERTLDYLHKLPRPVTGTRAAPERPNGAPHPEPNKDKRRSVPAIRAALACIPNDVRDWDEWCRIGMATWAASAGSQDGFEAWADWSARNECHNDAACAERWQHWFRSPPKHAGFATLYHAARQHRPLFVAPSDPAIDDTPPGGEPHPAKLSRPAILHLTDVEALPPPQWLIEGLIPEMGLTVIYGPPKSGKTFLALSAVLHIAAGKDWFGRKVVSGCVVYIAGEGLGGMGLRLKAMRTHYGIDANIPFYVVPRAIDFTQPDAAAYLVKLVRDTVGDEPVGAVVIDTLARAMPGADENSAQEVGLVIAACDKVRDELCCAVLPIHHQGKDETRGLRGTSAIRGAVDASFRVTGSGKSVTMKNEDQKEAECAEQMIFEMVEQPVGIGRTSLVPVLREADDQQGAGQPDKPDIPSGLTGLAYATLTDAIAGPDSAQLPPLEGLPLNTRGVRMETFRREFYARTSSRSPEARQKAFVRAVDALVSRRLIGVRDPWIWRA